MQTYAMQLFIVFIQMLQIFNRVFNIYIYLSLQGKKIPQNRCVCYCFNLLFIINKLFLIFFFKF